MLSIDHVAVAVPDLDLASRDLERRSGYAPTACLNQPAWGTGAVIVPLAQGFVELIAVKSPQAAAANLIGRRVAAAAVLGGAVVAWAVAPSEIEPYAASRGLLLQPGARTGEADGSEAYSWRMAGLVNAFFTDLPLLIRWDAGANPHARAADRAGRTLEGRLSSIDVGEPAALDVWLGDEPRNFMLHPVRTERRRCAGIAGADGAEILVP